MRCGNKSFTGAVVEDRQVALHSDSIGRRGLDAYGARGAPDTAVVDNAGTVIVVCAGEIDFVDGRDHSDNGPRADVKTFFTPGALRGIDDGKAVVVERNGPFGADPDAGTQSDAAVRTHSCPAVYDDCGMTIGNAV